MSGVLGSWADAAALTGSASIVALLKGMQPAVGGAAVTPNDSQDLAKSSRALYVGGAGDVKVTTVDGSTITFSAVPAGTLLPVAVKRVFATLTTATNILALL